MYTRQAHGITLDVREITKGRDNPILFLYGIRIRVAGREFPY